MTWASILSQYGLDTSYRMHIPAWTRAMQLHIYLLYSHIILQLRSYTAQEQYSYIATQQYSYIARQLCSYIAIWQYSYLAIQPQSNIAIVMFLILIFLILAWAGETCAQDFSDFISRFYISHGHFSKCPYQYQYLVRA